jgi:hypothetical protein
MNYEIVNLSPVPFFFNFVLFSRPHACFASNFSCERSVVIKIHMCSKAFTFILDKDGLQRPQSFLRSKVLSHG